MKPLFADTGYWYALLSDRDQLHTKAQEVSKHYAARPIITNEMVLVELLNHFGTQGAHYRLGAVLFVEDLRSKGRVRIIPQTPELFAAALELYKQRPDKEWSLTDCASIVICQQEGISEILAHDHHFLQAGFVVLLRDPN